MPPALDQDNVAPSASVIVMIVLLKEAWICATACGTTRFSPRFLKTFFRFFGRPAFCEPELSDLAIVYVFFFLATAPRFGPFRVRAFVLVRWPRTGRLRRWRNPR